VGKLDGKVAFITGAARGQGRSHAIRLAQEGASIIAIDICDQIATVGYEMATPADLEQTVKEVEAEGGRIVARRADVREPDQLRAALEDGMAELGPVGIVLANAGIGVGGPNADMQSWHDVIAVNLTGVFNTVRVAIPHMIEAGQGGSIVITSSTAGLLGVGTNEIGLLGYTAAKTAVVGLMRCWANYLGPHFIRCNVVAPTACRTPMSQNLDIEKLFEFDPNLARAMSNAMPIDMVEPIDISNAIAWLVSDEARYVSGTVVPVDAGSLNHR
jgi:SDR family mycofactocin-dependent oxidoreductase